MPRRPRPIPVHVLPATVPLLRLYRGQSWEMVLHRAMLLLATADGHLTADGRPISARAKDRGAS